MSEEIAVIPEQVRMGSLNASGSADVIQRATVIATELKNIIKNKKLYKTIGNKEFVQVEGWSTLGAMLGVLPRERHVSQIENGYEAYVELIRASDGVIIGGASAICTRDEKNWGSRDEYAVRSMAITRATGKAFRLGFSWIMTLAGYEVTPAEEMPSIIEAEVKEEVVEMTLDQAMTLVNSENVKYGDLPSDKLAFITNNKKAPALKRKAAQIILASRSQEAA